MYSTIDVGMIVLVVAVCSFCVGLLIGNRN